MPTSDRTSRLSQLPRHALLIAALAAAVVSSACAPLVIGGAMVGGALVATDRRTSGTQVEDEGIEYKAAARIRDNFGGNTHVSVNSYNRLLLLTGEVASEADRVKLENVMAGVENVRTVLNETGVMPPSSVSTRSNDLLTATKVKAALVDAPDLLSNAFYVVVERDTVFLMGRVTEREAKRATEIVRGVSSVKKVVRAFEIISEDELARTVPSQAKSPAPTK
ncbi:BON domain-containing protein [Roseateles koreensis]|uniref:BON domain-containing protein n=1 Tax=Roseateles koreensis TaxID=2987526 RepID=A0ABT5KSL8_9BURK|nr:BON domain-containing protein [Roseateles koreensis]MDC8785435.1 BON domain-containing protein [Roseateles koreensis]